MRFGMGIEEFFIKKITIYFYKKKHKMKVGFFDAEGKVTAYDIVL